MTIVSSSLAKGIKTCGSGTHAVIKFLKQDKDKGDGWTKRYQFVNEYNCWTKIFPNEEVPVKVLNLSLREYADVGREIHRDDVCRQDGFTREMG